jgi:hypothetical protein
MGVVNNRGLRNKIPEFHLLIHYTKCNVNVGTESWLAGDNSEVLRSSEVIQKSSEVQK